MSRRFNTAGPCKPDIHYVLPALRRLPGVRDLIDQQTYFVLHAPRQVGKTTSLRSLAVELTREGRYTALLVSMEVGAAFHDDPGAAELAILETWRAAASTWLPRDLQPPPWPAAEPGARIFTALHAWAVASPRPLVVFLDEIDALRDDALTSVLRQLRDGFQNRPGAFPWSLALCGMRDVRDYKISANEGGRLGTSSPFNIKTESITLRDFTESEVAELYAQHTAETGQAFLPDAVARAFELTQGQPWLVNALARQLVETIVTDLAQPIRSADVDRAKEILIERQDTHLDSLAERLREPRVRAVIEPILAGGVISGDVPDDDRRFVLDLGLARRSAEGGLTIANPIYREVIPRVLASGPRDSLPRIQVTWLNPDGRLDAERLLDAFLAFWRRHGEPLLRSAPYHEIAPHLVLMAFLHRVANGGGTIEREYAIGSGRMDICLRYDGDVLAIELKVWRDHEPDPMAEGLAQLDSYLAGLGLERGGAVTGGGSGMAKGASAWSAWLVVFDRRSGQPRIAERTGVERSATPSGREVALIRA